ncbi:MAG: Adenylosuccinate synthetase [Bacteroidetes bacterium ADurb.Bin217]|nr:MAG: Adenylosuccinate synthetase [Bacteroidetes bacterium ADurb.Bin217]
MNADILLGLQWGDEGKGKIVDVLTPKYDIIARFQGGPNAGHTLVFNNVKHVLHTIPSGIFRANAMNVIGNGVVIDPYIFKEEIDKLVAHGIDVKSKIIISSKAHIIMPSHKALDEAYENDKGDKKIGSTKKGIGPTYTDKIARTGLRVGDILLDFNAIYNSRKQQHAKILANYSYSFDIVAYEQKWFEGIALIKSMQIIDTEYYINKQLRSGKSVLCEGAQGTLLDIEFGSYPFVTSSNTISAGACVGLGISPKVVGKVFGIFKAYCTRVGSGPFPTELFDETGALMQKYGNEFGSTTGRPRRCGWLDLVALKYAIMLNGVTQLFMMKIDVMNTFDTIKVCTGYSYKGEVIDYMPNDIEGVVPVYKEFKGWNCELPSNSYADLPQEIKTYIEFIETETGVPVQIISTGPEREKTIIR